MLEFFWGMVGSRPVEWIAVACGIINVSLIIRRSIWNYPFGFLVVTLYFFIFWECAVAGLFFRHLVLRSLCLAKRKGARRTRDRRTFECCFVHVVSCRNRGRVADRCKSDGNLYRCVGAVLGCGSRCPKRHRTVPIVATTPAKLVSVDRGRCSRHWALLYARFGAYGGFVRRLLGARDHRFDSVASRLDAVLG